MSGQLPDLDEPISFAVDNGAQAGPFTMRAILESVRTGERASNTLVWWAGEPDWVSFDSVPGLVALVDEPVVDAQPPPPEAPAPDPMIGGAIFSRPDGGEPDPMGATETVDVGGAAGFGGLDPLGDADPAPGDVADVWRDVPAEAVDDDATQVVTGEELAADFGSVVDSGSGLFETQTDAFEDTSAGMPDDEAGIGESLSGAFDTLDADEDDLAEVIEDAVEDDVAEVIDDAVEDGVAEVIDDAVEAETDEAPAGDFDATDTLIVSDGDQEDGFGFTQEHDFFDPTSGDDAELGDDQPPAPTEDAQPTSLQTVSERIEALGAESRAALGGAGVLGSGQRLFDAVTDDDELAEEAEVVVPHSGDPAGDLDDHVEGAPMFDAAGEVSDDADADADHGESTVDDESEDGAAPIAEHGEADAEVDAALDELDDIAEETMAAGDESDSADDEPAPDALAPEANADLEAHFGHLREAAAAIEGERNWAASLDDVLLSVMVGRALDAGYSVVDLRSISPSHIARFERATDSARLLVALDQLGPVATETQLAGHHTSMLMSWGRPVDAGDLPESDEDGDAGQIGVHGDAETGYAYADIELIVPLVDYIDAEYALDDESVGRDFDAAHHGLQRAWYDRFG